MKNIMICVTQQKTCDRLIRYGNELLENDEDSLFIIHVAHYEFKFLGNSKESEALEYLYEKSLDYGANLTVVRSNNVLETLVDIVNKNNITHVVLGEKNIEILNKENLKFNDENISAKLIEKIGDKVDVRVISSN